MFVENLLPDLVDDGGLEVHEDGPGHVLARPGLGEEGVEAVISPSDGLVTWHLAIWLDPWKNQIKWIFFCPWLCPLTDRAPGSRAPSTRSRSGSRPGPRGRRYTLSKHEHEQCQRRL